MMTMPYSFYANWVQNYNKELYFEIRILQSNKDDKFLQEQRDIQIKVKDIIECFYRPILHFSYLVLLRSLYSSRKPPLRVISLLQNSQFGILNFGQFVIRVCANWIFISIKGSVKYEEPEKIVLRKYSSTRSGRWTEWAKLIELTLQEWPKNVRT